MEWWPLDWLWRPTRAAATPAAAEMPLQDHDWSAEGEVVIDWQSAMLEEYGLGPKPKVGASGSAPLPIVPTAGVPWMPNADSQASLPGRNSPLYKGERIPLRPLPRERRELPAALHGFEAGQAPRHPAVYQALLHHLYDPHRDHLLRSIREEPLFAYAAREWYQDPVGRRTAADADVWRRNLELSHVLYDRLSKLMGSLYDFDPAPLGFHEALPAGALGMYVPNWRTLFVASSHLRFDLAEVMDTIAHEQIHCFQHQQIMRVKGGGLTPEECSLALVWRQETRDAGSNPPATSTGFEYFAYHVGGRVAQFVRKELLSRR